MLMNGDKSVFFDSPLSQEGIQQVKTLYDLLERPPQDPAIAGDLKVPGLSGRAGRHF